MVPGEVVLLTLPQADGKSKSRPAIILSSFPPFGDLLVCGISKQLQNAVNGLDDIIAEDDRDFVSSGLKCTSLIRVGFIARVTEGEILRSIGRISPERHRRLIRQLCTYIQQEAL